MSNYTPSTTSDMAMHNLSSLLFKFLTCPTPSLHTTINPLFIITFSTKTAPRIIFFISSLLDFISAGYSGILRNHIRDIPDLAPLLTVQLYIYIQHLFARNIFTIDRLRNIANLNYIKI